MLYPCNQETQDMSQSELEAYYDGAMTAMNGGANLPNRVYDNPSIAIGNAFRKGHAAQLSAMKNDSSII